MAHDKMDEKTDKITLWVARTVFVLMTVIVAYLLFRFGLKVLHYWPYLGLCSIGYIAAGWVSFTGAKPDFVPYDAKANREAYKRIWTMLTIFGISGIVIWLWIWLG